jgi:hypothetical protein
VNCSESLAFLNEAGGIDLALIGGMIQTSNKNMKPNLNAFECRSQAILSERGLNSEATPYSFHRALVLGIIIGASLQFLSLTAWSQATEYEKRYNEYVDSSLFARDALGIPKSVDAVNPLDQAKSITERIRKEAIGGSEYSEYFSGEDFIFRNYLKTRTSDLNPMEHVGILERFSELKRINPLSVQRKVSELSGVAIAMSRMTDAEFNGTSKMLIQKLQSRIQQIDLSKVNLEERKDYLELEFLKNFILGRLKNFKSNDARLGELTDTEVEKLGGYTPKLMIKGKKPDPTGKPAR